MLKSYDPEKAFGLTHIVETTYMFDNGKVVVRTPIESECAGADLLSTCVDDSDWWATSTDSVNMKVLSWRVSNAWNTMMTWMSLRFISLMVRFGTSLGMTSAIT